MKLSRLYIENFMCYDDAYVDFNEFSSALIVGRVENNGNDSNGAGKTTLFKAIEFVLFGYSDSNLENIIRDDTDKCSVTFDFTEGDEEYRATRTRTRKGISDISLYKRTAAQGDETKSLHSIKGDRYSPVSDKEYWQDISGRRASDTEKELAKLIKVNLKTFRIFVHFMQHDFSGLATATPEKRKAILRDALNLIIYTKLEKIAKEKSTALAKEASRFSILIENLGDPDKSLLDLSSKLLIVEQELNDRAIKLEDLETSLNKINEHINQLTNDHSNLEGKFSALLVKEQSLNNEKSRIEISIKEYTTKKANIIQSAKDIMAELQELENTQLKLIELDFNQIDICSEQIISNKEKVAQLSLTIQNDMLRIEKLKKPIPEDGECEECRQPITAEHRLICQKNINLELKEKQNSLQNCKKEITYLNTQNTAYQQKISQLTLSKQHLESVNNKIATKKKEIVDKRSIHEEYKALLEKFNDELVEKNKEIETVSEELKNSSIDEAKVIHKKIQLEKQNLNAVQTQIAALNKEIVHFNNGKAVLQHDINQRTEDKRKKIELTKLLKEIEEKLEMYPAVIQAFSSTGIPNLIIQNVLDDLQLETNHLLNQLKPGLQLSFAVEKTIEKTGDQADTLDITYTVNGKKRYYENISGAMQMAVNFSLKLGLSFLLQKLSGVDVKFLLLDEITQSFDMGRVDFFMDIVKFFQKDYTILVITHDDRLKDKFSHAIFVEQDINMISRAKVVSSW